MTHLIYPTTNFKAIEQVTVERGEGCYVWDNHGNKYLEGLAGLWCTALGYGNQEVIATATEQMSKLTLAICLEVRPTRLRLIWPTSSLK